MSGSVPTGGLPLAEVLSRWEAIVHRWRLDPDERSALLGGFEPGPVDRVETYGTAGSERRMRLVVELEPILHRVHPSIARVRRWLRAENASLDGRTPIEVMASSPEWTRWLIDSVGLSA